MNKATPRPAFDEERVSSALARPRIVSLSRNLQAVSLDVMKIIPARHILHQAWQLGRIDAGTTIVESSSGNFALGLAIVCREMGLKLHIVGDPAIDASLRRMLCNLGAIVDIIEKPDAFGAYQRLRLERVAQVLADNRDAYWVQQYDNPANPQAYGELAATIVEAAGSEFDLVAAVGSGGSSVGLATALRALDARITLTAVDTYRSILFGLPDGKRTLRGLGNSVMPKILDHTQFDQVHWMTSAQGNRAAIELHAQHGLFCGPTSGAAHHVAAHKAATNPGRRVVFIAPDTGYRYQDTIFNEDWLRANGEYADRSQREPFVVSHLDQVAPEQIWSCMDWHRRSLDDASWQASSRESELTS